MPQLIAFYSRAGENYVSGEIRNLSIGNTEAVASILRELTEAELFRIEPCMPYPQDYSECINRAKADQLRCARPELVRYPTCLERYDTVYLGFPNYWGTLPMPVFTFLERCDLSGKKVCLFCTHEGDGFGRSQEDVRNACNAAMIEAGPAILGAHVSEARELIAEWVSKRSV